MADRGRSDSSTWGSGSWTKDFSCMPPFFASQRITYGTIVGTADWKLFQSFRYGREKLRYEFPAPDGEYLIELYFTDPWFGTGGGMDCTGWRLFDVAVNNEVVIKDLVIWKNVGHDAALKKIIKAKVTGGLLSISFPQVASGQAVISAIAIASLNKQIKPALSPHPLFKMINTFDTIAESKSQIQDWLEIGDEQYLNEKITFLTLLPELYGAQWIKTSRLINSSSSTLFDSIQLLEDADIYISIDTSIKQQPNWLKEFQIQNTL